MTPPRLPYRPRSYGCPSPLRCRVLPLTWCSAKQAAQVALSSFHRWGNAGSERDSAVPSVAQPVGVYGRCSRSSPPSGREPPSRRGVSPPRPPRPLLFLGVLSLNPAPLSCLHSPRGTLALRSPFPPSEIVSISPTPPRIVGSGPCLLPRVLVLRSLCGPTFPPRPAWLADASSGPQDSVGEGDRHLQKIDPRSSFLKLFCTEEPHGISVKNSDSWAPDIEPVGLGTFYTVAWSDSDPGVGTTV